MRRFKYKAKKGHDQLVEGVLVAESQDEAVELINGMGLLPIDLMEETSVTKVVPKKKETVKNVVRAKGKRVNSKDLMVFYRQLGSLVKAGVPILRALSVVALQFQNRTMRNLVEKIRDEVREGQALSETLTSEPTLFSAFDVAMVHGGESVGKIDQALFRLADYRDQQEELRAKVKSALAYPAFVIGAAALTVIFMLSYVIPKFSLFFEDLGQELPMPTQVLMSVSEWCQTGWVLIAILTVSVLLLLRQMSRKRSSKIMLDHAVLKIPRVGDLILKSEIAQLSRSLELLLGSGMQLLNAIKISRAILQNEAIRSEFEACYSKVADGGSFSEALEQTNLFPPLMVHLSAVGEESGQLDESLGQVAAWYERDMNTAIKVLTNLLEPMVILVVGLILGAIIIAVLLPVFSINAMVS